MADSTEDLVARFDRDGFAIAPALFDAATVDRVRRVLFGCASRFSPALAGTAHRGAETDVSPWWASAFDHAVCELYEAHPERFEAFYDVAQNAAILRELAGSRAVTERVAACLRERPDGLALSGVQLRIDVPRDPKNTHAWHQERAYYIQNAEGHRGLVLSVPLQDTPASGGALRICPGSHRAGVLRPHDGDMRSGHSGEKRLRTEHVKEFEPIAAGRSAGDGLLMSMNTYHQAGRNESQRVRFTFLCRYHQMLSDPTYVALRTRFEANEITLAEATAVHGDLLS